MNSKSTEDYTVNKFIYSELSVENLKKLLLETQHILVIKFGAEWCGPCQKIKTFCHNNFSQLPENVICFDLDIDEETNLELFTALKSKKMIKGVPTLFAYNCAEKRDINLWYIPDSSISGANQEQLTLFFNSVQTMVA